MDITPASSSNSQVNSIATDVFGKACLVQYAVLRTESVVGHSRHAPYSPFSSQSSQLNVGL